MNERSFNKGGCIMNASKLWFRHKFIVIVFLLPLLIVLSFVYGLLPGFNSAANSQDQMKVAIVNQDNNEIAKTKTLVFKTFRI